jgi:hypothetical protein
MSDCENRPLFYARATISTYIPLPAASLSHPKLFEGSLHDGVLDSAEHQLYVFGVFTPAAKKGQKTEKR